MDRKAMAKTIQELNELLARLKALLDADEKELLDADESSE